MQALLINNAVRSGVGFERWTTNYANLNQFLDPVPLPFNNISHDIPLGVDLHWKLPSALTHGTADAGSTNVQYPFTPNRWVVVRLATTAGSTAPQQMTAWVIQSDYLGNDGTTPYADPFSPRGAVQTTLLGKNVLIDQWQGEAGGPLFLRATGTADITFTAYQPGLVNVYAFHDDTTALADNTLLTYLVAGWYSDHSQDPLVVSTPAQLNWSILGGDGSQTPVTSVFHASIFGVKWQSQTIPPRDDSSAASMQVAVGYTAIDGLAAVIANNAGQPSGSELETKLQAFQYGVLQTLDQPDGQAQLELLIRQAWFGSAPGGTLWDIVAVSQGQTTTAPIDRTSVPVPPPLTPPQAAWLAALNVAQRNYDVARRELMTMQWEVFALWWKQQRGQFVIGQQRTYGVDLTVILQWINDALDSTQPSSFLSQVLAAQANVATLAAAVPDPASQASIDTWSAMIPGASVPPTLQLRPRSMPSFAQPADPVLLIAGITPPGSEADATNALPCRLSTAATTGVNVISGGQSQPVSSATGKIGSVLKIPNTSKLVPVIATAINALAVETYFADPNNAASIAGNGLNISDPATIASLAAAIAAGTAEIATIPQPLQAAFAFAPWQQAWSPLFIEWHITWLPGVTVNPTGPFEPPPPARWNNSGGAQDNWPYDPANWKFDGGDDVTERGSEYYQWTAGEIWGPDKVQQQSYTGRTFLTPQATYLLMRRLADYVKLHPDDKDLAQVEALIQAIGETRFLSQSLSGFNGALAMRALYQTPPPPPDQPVGKAIAAEYHGVPFVAIGDQTMDFGGGSPFFFPVRGGFFQFERLLIVDAFGQVLDLLQANGNVSGDPANFFPIRGAGLVPDPGAGITTPQRRMQQAPRVVQPNRLDLRLLDAYDDGKEIFLTAGTNPVCGWFLPNHLDQSIAVYDAPGNPLGELLVLVDSSDNPTVTWLPAPDVPNPITDPSQIANPHLRDSLTPFTSASGGIPASQRATAFRALFASIDETLWMIDPIGGQGDQDLAVLIGRPLAMVRSQVQFELFGRPSANQSWRDTLQGQMSDSTKFSFEIRLGSTELLDDGMIGYFTGDTYTAFNAVHPSSTVHSPYIVPIAPGNYLSLPFDYPAYTTQNLTMLLDPRGTVHATTGVLPSAKLNLPPEFWVAALEQMVVTFRMGPVLTDPSAIRLPFPAEHNGTWSWIRKLSPGSAMASWEAAPIIAADTQARLAGAPPHLIDGWLKFQPKDPTKS